MEENTVNKSAIVLHGHLAPAPAPPAGRRPLTKPEEAGIADLLMHYQAITYGDLDTIHVYFGSGPQRLWAEVSKKGELMGGWMAKPGHLPPAPPQGNTLQYFPTEGLEAARRNLEHAKANRSGGLLKTEQKALDSIIEEIERRKAEDTKSGYVAPAPPKKLKKVMTVREIQDFLRGYFGVPFDLPSMHQYNQKIAGLWHDIGLPVLALPPDIYVLSMQLQEWPDKLTLVTLKQAIEEDSGEEVQREDQVNLLMGRYMVEIKDVPAPVALAADEKAIPGFAAELEECVLKVKGKAKNPYAVCRSTLRNAHGLPVAGKK